MARCINAAGLAILKSCEGLALKAYLCPAKVWTIGYGHTGPEVKAGQIISELEAERLLRADLARFERAVESAVTVPLTDNQFAACVSLAFNIGAGAFAKSGLVRLLNAKDYTGAAEQFRRWTKGGGQVLPGLTARRDTERALFLKDF